MHNLVQELGGFKPGSQNSSWPTPCVVEDDNGERLLVINDPEQLVSTNLRFTAKQAGAFIAVSINPHVLTKLKDDLSGHRVHGDEIEAERPSRQDDSWVAYEGALPTAAEARELLNPPVEASNFVHLHTHSEFSALDGLSTPEEMVNRAKEMGQSAIAVTDHGTCAAHPHLQAAAKEAGIKPIFGCEIYLVDDRLRRPRKTPTGLKAEDRKPYEDEQKEIRSYWHLILWAENEVGLHNLWALTTDANKDGFYYKPRADWASLEKYSEGLICSTACLSGPVSRAIIDDDIDTAVERFGRLMSIFPDRLYAELHTNHEDIQPKVNLGITLLAQTYGVPLIAVSDSHYCCAEHKDSHKVWIAAQTNNTLADDSGLFTGDSDYHIQSADEVRKALADQIAPNLIEEAIANTAVVAERCNAELKGNPAPPVFSKVGGPTADVEKLVDICVRNWERKIGPTHRQEEYTARFEEEMKLLIDKKLCGYYLIVSDYCRWAKRQGILVGPGRGSGGGSLVAFLSDITEIDPVDADLLFARFMTPGRKELPDFDIDFPSRRMDEVLAYIDERWGKDSVVRVGTHVRLKSKGIIKDMARVFKGGANPMDFSDQQRLSAIITRAEASSAGLGISWDELWDVEAETLAPYREKYPEIFRHADILHGRLKSYGKHAAGVIISTDGSLEGQFPLRRGDDDTLIAEYDMNALAMLGFVKFDFLGLRNLDTVQLCLDLVKENRGVDVSPYDWKIQYLHTNMWDSISAGNTLGCFQIETTAGTKVCKDVRPKNLQDLADVITLDRPGPMRSGLDKAYINRRFGKAPVTYVDPRLETVLDKTYGVMLYQEDIMNIAMTLAGYDQEEADKLRKILGKKLVDQARVEGQKFIPACIERGMPEDKTRLLWKQMEEFSRYAFNKAHAYGYAVLASWTAWLKENYPEEFYVAVMSTVKADRLPDFVDDARSHGFKVLPPDINDSIEDFNTPEAGVIRYGFQGVSGIGPAAVKQIIAGQPYVNFEDFMSRSNNMGMLKTLVRAGAFDKTDPNRRWLEEYIAHVEAGDLERCVDWDPNMEGAPNDLPCHFDWSTEPVKLGKRGQPLKNQLPIPTTCRTSCRHYRPKKLLCPEPEAYTAREIRELEKELLGIYLSSTPFDGILPEDAKQMLTAKQAEEMPDGVEFTAACLVSEIKERIDKNRKRYAFVKFGTRDGMFESVCFSSRYGAIKSWLDTDDIVFGSFKKTSRGYTLNNVMPLKAFYKEQE